MPSFWLGHDLDGELIPGCTPNLSACCPLTLGAGFNFLFTYQPGRSLAHTPFAIEDGQASSTRKSIELL
jgi:hypothetical protein